MFKFRLMTALIICFSLPGCLATAIVGTATGAATMSHDERSLGRQFDDAATASKIDARLIAEKNMPSRWISIDVVNGEVTLTGSLPTQNQIDRAIYITKSIHGVRSVDSKLTVGAPKMRSLLSDSWITTRVKTRLLNDKVVSGLKIHVETVNGKVYLQGEVKQASERVRAKEIAHSVAGVTAVVDLMQSAGS
ncbi:BON domain-containing protein [Mariprofundus ferrooxydans]|uniref:BON domain-containing protein n=1 Tax=Mariprofundus ferrooxydans TaxID=314344 RepID=UPI000363BFD7|nr:BON domain-containing protein [Mariprofundus ferrooxydans]